MLLLSAMLAACSDKENLGSQEVQADQDEVTVIKQIGKLYFPDGHGDVQFILNVMLLISRCLLRIFPLSRRIPLHLKRQMAVLHLGLRKM